MRIAFIVGTFPGLSQTFVLNQITGLLDMGHEVEIFAECSNDKKRHPEVEKYRLMDKVHCIPKNKVRRVLKAPYIVAKSLGKDPIKALKSLNLFKYGIYTICLKLPYTIAEFPNKKFDIIQCHFGHNGNVGAILKEMGFEGKLVTMFHGYGIRLGEKKGKNFYSRLFKESDCILAISDYNKKKLVEFGANPKKMLFHPVGIDIGKFPFKWKAPSRKPNTSIILSVGRLVEEKGFEYGIRAVGELVKRNPGTGIEYRIVGGGKLESRLRKLVKELGLEKVVRFLGPMNQEEVSREMQKAHIFMLPSTAESLPVVLMEAQCTGLPIVATSVGSIAEEVADSKSGFLVAAENAGALEEKLNYLIKHPEDWPQMGKIGHELVREHYDINKLNPQLAKIYETLLLEEGNKLTL